MSRPGRLGLPRQRTRETATEGAPRFTRRLRSASQRNRGATRQRQREPCADGVKRFLAACPRRPAPRCRAAPTTRGRRRPPRRRSRKRSRARRPRSARNDVQRRRTLSRAPPVSPHAVSAHATEISLSRASSADVRYLGAGPPRTCREKPRHSVRARFALALTRRSAVSLARAAETTREPWRSLRGGFARSLSRQS